MRYCYSDCVPLPVTPLVFIVSDRILNHASVKPLSKLSVGLLDPSITYALDELFVVRISILALQRSLTPLVPEAP